MKDIMYMWKHKLVLVLLCELKLLGVGDTLLWGLTLTVFPILCWLSITYSIKKIK
jgi:hypothetical protein